MALLAAARRFAATSLPRATATLPRAPLGFGGAARKVAAQPVVTSPRPLSIRYDSLFVQCFIAAIIHFVPQDAIFVTGLLAYWYNTASTVSPKKWHKDAEGALEEFKAKKGIDGAKVY